MLKSNRDSWQNARDDPNQDFREDNVHDTVYVLNKLISRVTELQRSGGDGGTLSLNTPREMEEILCGTLLYIQSISDLLASTPPELSQPITQFTTGD